MYNQPEYELDQQGPHQLYNVLRQSAGGVAVDEPLLDGDYIANQRELMAQQEQDEILERLARRMGGGGPGGPAAAAATAGHARGDATAPYAVSMAASNLTLGAQAGIQGILSAFTTRAGQGAGRPAAASPATAALGAAGVDAVVSLEVIPAGSKSGKLKADGELPDTAAAPAADAAPPKVSRIRAIAQKINGSPDFELVVILLIITNCITLALYNPLLPHGEGHNAHLDTADLVLNSLFTVEMIIRIIALGGITEYLASTWNLFDALMVFAGYTVFIPMGDANQGMEGLRALRALRALRPLRTIARFDALRSIVVCFMEAVPLLISVGCLIGFFLFVFGVAGTELFGSAYHQVCMDQEGIHEPSGYEAQDEYGCGARQCPANYTCTTLPFSMALEVAGNDNVGLSMLTTFQCMTMSGWSTVMYRAMDVISPAVCIFYIALVVFGGYFVLNLFLAVVKERFAGTQRLFYDARKAQRMMRKQRRRAAAMSAAARAGFMGQQHTNLAVTLALAEDDEEDKGKANIIQRTYYAAKRAITVFMVKRVAADELNARINSHTASGANSVRSNATARSGRSGHGLGHAHSSAPHLGLPGANQQPVEGAQAAAPVATSGATPGAAAGAAVGDAAGGVRRSLEGPGASKGQGEADTAPGNTSMARSSSAGSESAHSAVSSASGMSHQSGQSGYSGVSGATSMTSTTSTRVVTLLSAEEFDELVKDLPTFKRQWLRGQYRMRLFVESPEFTFAFLGLILLNTVALALIWDDQSATMEAFLHHSNTAFSSLFALEMVLKIIALGPWTYISDAWNAFDFLVVVISLVELALVSAAQNGANVAGLQSMRTLRILKSFRVLRVVKMFKYLESLKVISAVLGSSFSSFAAIGGLLALFWLVFSVVGLHVFGGVKLDPPDPMNNYDSLFNALVVNFNALNLENYQVTMWALKRGSNFGAVVYTLAWIILGNYIFLTLFLTVILEAFEKRYKVDETKAARRMKSVANMMSRIKGKVGRLVGGGGSQDGNGSVNSTASSRFSGWLRKRHASKLSPQGSQRQSSALLAPPGVSGSAAVGSDSIVSHDSSLKGSEGSRHGPVAEGSDVLEPEVTAPAAAGARGHSRQPHGWLRRCAVQSSLFRRRAVRQQEEPTRRSSGGGSNRHRAAGQAQQQQQQPETSNVESEMASAAAMAASSALPPEYVFPSLLNGGANGSDGWQLQQPYAAVAAAAMEEDFTWVEFLDTLAVIHGSPGSSSWRRRTSSSGGAAVGHPWCPPATAAAAPSGHSYQPSAGPISEGTEDHHGGGSSNSSSRPAGKAGPTISTAYLVPVKPSKPATAAAGAAAGGTAAAAAAAGAAAGPRPAAEPGDGSGPAQPEAHQAGSAAGSQDSQQQQQQQQQQVEATTLSVADTLQSSTTSSPGSRTPVAWTSTAAAEQRTLDVRSSMPGTPGTPTSPALRAARTRMQSALRKPNKDFAESAGPSTPMGGGGWHPGVGERGTHATKHITFMLDNDVTSGKWKARRSMPGAARKAAGSDGLAALADGRVLQRAGPGATTRGVRQRRVVAATTVTQGITGAGAVHVLGPHGAGDAAASAAAASPFAAAAGGQASMVSRTGSSTGLPGLRKLQRSASNASDATTVSDVSEHSDQFHSEAGSGVYSDDTSANGDQPKRRYKHRHIPPLAGMSLGLFSEKNLLRRFLYALVVHPWFDNVMLFIIFLDCVSMAYEYPDMSRANMDGMVLAYAGIVVTTIFVAEMIAKIIAFGFKPYARVLTNQVDGAIAIVSAVLLVLEHSNMEILRSLRVLRAMKALRVLTRSSGMQIIFKSITLSLAAMANVSMVVLLMMVIFAILGVQLFHGKFWHCTDPGVSWKHECEGLWLDPKHGQVVPREWVNNFWNFDHLGNALLTLFIMATLDGYAEIVEAGMHAPSEIDAQPTHLHSWSNFWYFVAYIVVVSYTLLNLYIGVVFFQFSRIRMQSIAGSAFLTPQQQEWSELSRMVLKLQPPDKTPVPRDPTRRQVYYFVKSRQFDWAMLAVILTNSALMAVTWYGEPVVLLDTLEYINKAYTAIYIAEAALKIYGLGWQSYWKSSWNQFDFFLCATSVVDVILAITLSEGIAALQIQKILRLMRLARVVRLIRGLEGVRNLVGTLVVSLPAFYNVGALLFLFFFIWGYVGVILFGKVARNRALDEHTNFERFWMALLVLLRVATADNWADVFRACMVKPPHCSYEAGTCGSWAAIPYFISFVLLITIVMLNLFTAVIIENFEKQQEQDKWKLNPHTLEEFVELWSEYDDGTGTIDAMDLEKMLMRLPPPLGLGAGASSKDVLRFVFDLDIPLQNGRVPFHRTSYELVRRCCGTDFPEGLLKEQIDALVSRHFRGLKSDNLLNFSVAMTVMAVQRKWRARMKVVNLRRKKEARAARGLSVPSWEDTVAMRYRLLKAAWGQRQAGRNRWKPAAGHSRQWESVQLLAAAEAADEATADAAGAVHQQLLTELEQLHSSNAR